VNIPLRARSSAITECARRSVEPERLRAPLRKMGQVRLFGFSLRYPGPQAIATLRQAQVVHRAAIERELGRRSTFSGATGDEETEFKAW